MRIAWGILQIILLLLIIAGLSALFNNLWGGKPETIPKLNISITDLQETPAQAAARYNIPVKAVAKALGLTTQQAGSTTFAMQNLSKDKAQVMLTRAAALAAEDQSKNWLKIVQKFALWVVFMGFMLYKLRKNRITSKNRWVYYALATLIFGVILGADPGPMGTVKDAIVLWGQYRVVFMPRLIAMLVFFAAVILANKFICAWGCQVGAVQDFIYNIARRLHLPVFKVPFRLSNTIRGIFLLLIIISAWAYSFDLVEPIDPFKLFKPAVLAGLGIAFIALIGLASAFIYRPWCNFFCPFGYIGRVLEQFSLQKIRVNRATCINCRKCVKACPTSAMLGILDKHKVKQDCFACGACQQACPVDAIKFK